jgi:outer membrane protein assembly factor BamA
VLPAAALALALTLAGSADPALRTAPVLAWCQDPAVQSPTETIVAIQVHGNHLSTDDEVIAIAGVKIGDPFVATTLDDIKERLEKSGKFDNISVLKRFASIADPSQVMLVIIANEGAVRIEFPKDGSESVRVVKRKGLRNWMIMPIFDAEDGYGVTFGIRAARVGELGRNSRLSFPLTYGGLKRAGAELEYTFERGPFTRVEFGGAVQRQRNPAFDINDDRQRGWVKAERAMGPVRASATTSLQRVSFADLRDTLTTVGGDVAYDTRLDPIMPRNAVFASAGVERVFLENRDAVNRTKLDGRVYVGLFRQYVLVVRAVRQQADAPLPPYLKYLLGGWSSLRGFEAGSFFGDTVAHGSIEIRVPLNATISVAKLGVNVFADFGKAYDRGQRFDDVPLERGYGGGVFITLAAFRLSLAVAHGVGSGTRVNFGGGLTF